jgi:hypothetical protein
MFVLDIETGPLPEDQLRFPEFEAPANYKTPEAIANNIAKQRANYIAKAALSELSGKVVAVGMQIVDQDTWETVPAAACCESKLINERFILNWTWTQLANPVPIITFDGTRFDIPFLVRRSRINKIRVPSWIIEGEYVNNLISGCDVRRLWNLGDRNREGSLDDISQACGMPPKIMSGGMFYSVLLENPVVALEYLTGPNGDLARTLELYKRCTNYV